MEELTRIIKTYSDQIINWSLAHGARVALILVIFLGLFFLLRFALRRFIRFYLKKEDDVEKEKRVQTLTNVISFTGGFLLICTGAMMVVAELGIDVKPLLASLGIGGLAIGFGGQSLVKDVISGFFMLLEDQVRVNDVVEAAGKSGQVESVGLRTLVLRDLAGNRIIIPNGEIKGITNMTYEYSRYVFKIGVAYKEDVGKVVDLMKRVGEELARDKDFGSLIKEPLEIFGLDEFSDSSMVILARITTLPIQQWAVGREYKKRLKQTFDAEGIEIPYPHRKIFMEMESWERSRKVSSDS